MAFLANFMVFLAVKTVEDTLLSFGHVTAS